jgi:hypothetical protein
MASPGPKRNWLWFYCVLAFLAVTAILVPLVIAPMVHGLRPVTAETIQAARELWAHHGPRDYDMEYKKKGSVNGTFQVQVRDGKATSVTMDGRPLDPAQFHYHTMPALIDDLEVFFDLAQKPGSSPVTLRARFDPQDGHLLRYIYSKSGTPQQIEVSVRLRRLDVQ